jgi:predicted O-methyltransferase YrrM
MGTLETTCAHFGVSKDQPSPIVTTYGRFKDLPRLYVKLGFKVGAEIGVYHGEYSRWMLRGVPGLKLWGIDSWESYPGYKDFGKHDLDGALEIALESVKGYDCNLIKARSRDASMDFKDGSLDFVYIDGNHAYESVVEDLALWARKVRPGGIVAGHDYDDYGNKSRWREMHVMQAVDGWVKSYRIKPLIILSRNKGRSWLYVKE